MAIPGRKSKTVVLTVFLAALIAFSAAAVVETPGESTVWKNSEVQPQLQAQCNGGNSTVSSLKAELDSNITLADSTDRAAVNFSSEELGEKKVNWGETGSVYLSCTNQSGTVSEEIDFSSVEFATAESDPNGVGFLGQVMKDERGSLGNREGVLLRMDYSGISDSDFEEGLRSSSFFFGSNGPLQNPEQDLDLVDNLQAYDRGVKLYPFVEEYLEPDETFKVNFDGSNQLEGLSREVPGEMFDPFVHVWSSEVVNDPGRRMGFDKVRKGGYVYDLFMSYAPNDNFPESEIDDDNFVLTVKEKAGDWESGYQEVEDGKYEKMSILETGKPDSSNANYRVKIPEVGNTPLEDLPNDEKPYQFVLEFRYQDEEGPHYFTVDKMKVDKSENPSRFSGQVLDSGGNGVRADMLLEQVSSDDSYLVSSGSNGQFSKDLSTDLSRSFDMNLDFFDSGNKATEISLSGVDLSSSDLGSQDITALNYDYWEDPQSVNGVDVEGLKPVNMIAIRFGYDINNVDSVTMDFDSSEVTDMRDLRVYECDAWNFWGKNCRGGWEKIADNQNMSGLVSHNQRRGVANFEDISLYETSSSENILRNAYVIGTSAELQLQESVSLESTQVKHEGNLKASGVLVDENGDRVGDGDIELSLIDAKSDEEVWSKETSTDATGSFRFDERVDVEAGNYLLELEASKTPYKPLKMESDETINVYYERGLSLDVPTSPEINQGETSEISFDVSNTGQRPIEDIQISVEGVRDSYYSVSNRFSSVESGSKTVTIELNLPEDYCSYPCSNSPEFNVEVSGTSGGESVSSSALIPTTLNVEQPSQEQSETDQESSDEGSQQETEQSSVNNSTENSPGAFSQVNNMTGEFVQQQGELNIALALIMVFTMVLAAAVKKRKDGDGGDTRGRASRGMSRGSKGGARPNVSKPKVSSSEEKVEEGDEKDLDSNESEDDSGDSEIVEEEEEVPENVCDICGEEFKNSSGVKIHKKAVHE
jgi:hypothetical protein